MINISLYAKELERIVARLRDLLSEKQKSDLINKGSTIVASSIVAKGRLRGLEQENQVKTEKLEKTTEQNDRMKLVLQQVANEMIDLVDTVEDMRLRVLNEHSQNNDI